jgi:tetratricopeptide (TPR) repeat protein
MYYAAGQWEDADRNLRQALALCPAYLTQPAELVRFLADYALSARIKDPIGFVGGLTEHLPSGVGLGGLNAQLLAQVYAGLALRRYGAGQAREANRLLAEAIALYPEMLRDPSLFPRLLVHSSLTLPVGDSGAYIEHVFGSLPTSARALSRFRSRVIGEVAAASAFEDYHAARHTAVIRKVARTARYRPARLVNRGVVSIFVRSLGRLAWSKLAHRGGNTAGRRDRWWSVE